MRDHLLCFYIFKYRTSILLIIIIYILREEETHKKSTSRDVKFIKQAFYFIIFYVCALCVVCPNDSVSLEINIKIQILFNRINIHAQTNTHCLRNNLTIIRKFLN